MDGSLLLSGSEDQTARVWHIYSRQCLRVLNHRGNMNLLIGLQSFLALRTPHYYRHINNTYSNYTPRQKSFYTSLTKSISQCYWLSRGGGYSTKFLTGGSTPRSNLLYFYTHFCQKGYSFHIPSIDKWYPLDIPSLEIHIAFKCWKINLKQERFLDFFTAIKCICQSFWPFNAPKWQIYLPFHTLQQAATISCDGEEKCDVTLPW